MTKSIILNAIGDELKNLGKTAGKQIGGVPKALAQTAAQQVTPPPQTIENTPEKLEGIQTEAKPQQSPDQAEFLKGLYGPSEKKEEKKSKETLELIDHNKDKTPEEQQKILQLRNQLHSQYYQRLTTSQPRPEEARKDQESASDRMERLKMEDLEEKKKKEEKKKPIKNAENTPEKKSAGAG